MTKKFDEFAKELNEVTPALVERAKGVCEVHTVKCGEGMSMLHRHHRLTRAHGGTNELDNLLLACDGCHTYIHHNPRESYEKGWMVRGNGIAFPS